MFTRRTLLKTLPVLGASALTGSLFRRAAHAEAQGAGPKRFVVLFTPNGTIPSEFWPDGDPGGPDSVWDEGPSNPTVVNDFPLRRILAPLERHRSDMTIIRGPGTPMAEWFYRDTPQGVSETALRCDPSAGVTDHKVYMLTTGVCPTPSYAGGISIDQEIAKTLGHDTLHESLVVSAAPVWNNRRGFISYLGADRPVPPEHEPLRAYRYVFGPLAGDTGEDPAKALTLEKSVLDAVRADITRLEARVPSSERFKLEGQLEAVRRFEVAAEQSSRARAQCIQQEPGYPSGTLPVPEALRLQLKNVAAAFACDLTRVASVAVAMGGGDNLAVDWVPDFPSVGYHDLAHQTLGAGGVDRVAGMDELWIRMSREYVEILAEFVDELKAIPEGDGTVFDNTAIVWIHEMLEGGHWDMSQLPTVILGSAGGALATGRYVRCSRRTSFNDVWTTVSNAVGHRIERFGNSLWSNGELGFLKAE